VQTAYKNHISFLANRVNYYNGIKNKACTLAPGLCPCSPASQANPTIMAWNVRHPAIFASTAL